VDLQASQELLVQLVELETLESLEERDLKVSQLAPVDVTCKVSDCYVLSS